MQPKARFTLIREQSMGATSAVFESDFDSVEAARQGAVTRARESMPWASQAQAAVMCAPLESVPVGRTVKVNGWHYRIKANDVTPGARVTTVDHTTVDDVLGTWECIRVRWDRDESVWRLAMLEPDADTLRAAAERAWDLATEAINAGRPEAREIYAEWGDDLKRVADRVDPVY